MTLNTDHPANKSSTREPTARYLLVWSLVIGGYVVLLAIGLLGGFAFIRMESDCAAVPTWATFALAAMMIGMIIGLAIVLFERLKARRRERYIDINR